MMSALKSEFRKLLTIRSTYIISALLLVIVVAVSFYFLGVKADDVSNPVAPDMLQLATSNLAAVVGMFAGVIAILHICHEYRYNTISYSLTITSRIKVLIAKALTIALYALMMSLLTLLVVMTLMPLGVQVGHATWAPQDFPLWEGLWRTAAYVISKVWIGMIFGFLFRNLVFSIVAYFMVPAMLEPILINLLHVNGNWLPTTAQGGILGVGPPPLFSPLASLGVVAIYLAVGWIIASVLFVRRDTN